MRIKSFWGMVWLIVLLLSASHVRAWWTSEVFESKNYDWDEYPEERAIAIGDDGTIHIVYQVGQRIIHAYKDGLVWHKEIAAEWGGSNLSIAVDSEGNIHLSFCRSYYEGAPWDFEYYINSIHYATNSTGAWVTETVKSENSPYGQASISNLVLDANGNPHLIYVNRPPDMEHAYKDSTGWHAEIISADSEYGEYQYLIFSISLDLDSNDNPHLIYQPIRDSTYLGKSYAYKDKGGWHFEGLDKGVYGTSIVLDSNDNPIIGNGFFLAHKDSTGWHFEQFVPPEDNCGDYDGLTPLAIDSHDNLHIVYACDGAELLYSQRSVLKYATRVGTKWYSEVVDSAHQYAFPPFAMVPFPLLMNLFGNHIGRQDSAIAVDSDGKPHMFYSKNWFYGLVWNFTYLGPTREDDVGIVELKHATKRGVID